MGNCLDCFSGSPASDPILDREARARAAEAAQARMQKHQSDPLAMRQAAAAAREKAAPVSQAAHNQRINDIIN